MPQHPGPPDGRWSGSRGLLSTSAVGRGDPNGPRLSARPSVVVVTGDSYLAPTLWTPDDVLIASDFGHHKTYSVATSRMATLINSTYAAETSVG